MRYLIVFILATAYLILPAQERLTSIVNEVQEEKIYIQEVDGIKYVIKTNPDDELSVFLLNENFTISHLYTNNFKNVYVDFLVHVVDEYVYLFDGNEPVKYNFILNEELRYTLPEGWFPTLWLYQGTRRPVVSARNATNSETKTFILSENGDIIEEDEDVSCFEVFQNHTLCSNRLIGSQRVYFAENIDSKERDTLIFGATNLDYRLENNGQDLVYIDNNNRICKYDGITAEKYCIPALTYNKNIYDAYRWIDDYLVLFHEDVDHISLFNAIDGSQTHIIDYEEFPFFSTNQLNAAYIVENRLVLQTSNDVLIVDLITLELDFYDTHSSRWTVNPLIDDRYLLVYEFLLQDNEYVLANKLIDLRDNTKIDLNFIGDIYMSDYAKVIPVGDDYLGVFWLGDYIQDIAFRISPENRSFTHVPEIQPRTSQGLPRSTTKLFKLGEDLAFVSEDIVDREIDRIYAIDGNKVNLVVSEEIYDFYPSGFIKLEDKLTYAVERVDSWDIFSFDGKYPSLEAEIPIPSTFMGTAGFLEKYVITDKNVFAIVQGLGFDIRKSLMRYDKINSTIEEVVEVEDLIFNDPLVSNGEDTYFFSYATLYHVDEFGETSIVLELDGESRVDAVFRQSGEFIYFFSMDGVFVLDGKDANQIYDNNLDFSLLGLQFSESRDFIDRPLLLDISSDVENTLLYLDGNQVREVNIGARGSSICVQENNYFFIQTTPGQNGPRKFLVYSGANDQLFDLTDFNAGQSILNIHELNGDTYIISHEGFADILNIYRMSADFNDSELVFTTPYDRFTPDPNFRILGNEGMLYTNEFIFQVDEAYQFHELNVTGNAFTPEMEIDENGFIYFIAKDEEYGNQLYRVVLVGIRLDVDDIEAIELFEVHPNPASTSLNLPNNMSGEYMIFNDVGQLLMQGDASTSQLDISKLSNGTYSMQVVSDRKIFVSRFAKIKN